MCTKYSKNIFRTKVINVQQIIQLSMLRHAQDVILKNPDFYVSHFQNKKIKGTHFPAGSV